MKQFKVLLVILCAGVVIGLVSFRPVKAQSAQQPYVLQITSAGISSFQDAVLGDDRVTDTELDSSVDYTDDGSGETPSAAGAVINRTVGGGTGQGPTVPGGTKPKSNPVLNQSFDGLNFRQQRLANHGNQFSVEPPDQGLCAGNGFVVEAVNDVLRVFDTAGNPLIGVVDLNTFFGYIPAIFRSTDARGPSITDPSCYFDPDTQRWFVIVLTLDHVGTTPRLAGTNHLDIAVSSTPSPLGTFTIFRLPVQNDGTQGTANHGCLQRGPTPGTFVPGPCLGDFPHIGADANGIYLTTNEFNFFAPGFRASEIYAIPKQTLASGAASVPVFLFDTAGFLLDGNPGFTVWPATSPDPQNSQGIEYFLSSVAVFNASQTDNRIRIWALSSTDSLNGPSPSLTLDSSFIGVNIYGRPPRADQKVGDVPLAACLNDITTVITSLGPPFTGCWQAVTFPEPAHNEVESNHVDSGDSRMMQVVFANGKLWSALDTAVTVSGATKAGIAFYIIQPSATPVSGNVVKQGVLALADNNLTYPAVGVTTSGRGVIAFTVLGMGGVTNPGHFPSAGFAALDALVGAGPLQIAAAGLGPDDGFTSYKAFVGPRGRNRWGDYGAAVSDGSTIWMASEYIGQTCTFSQYISAPFGSCGGTRASLGNWYTRITQVTP